MADISSSFTKVCEKLKFSDLNKESKGSNNPGSAEERDVFVSLVYSWTCSFDFWYFSKDL